MNVLVILCGVAIAGVALWAMASPPGLFALLERMKEPRAIWGVAGVRVAMGAIFVLAADGSRWPTFLTALGWFVIAAGVVTPLVGRERVARMVDWWRARPPAFVRAWCAFALAFGALVVFAGT